MAHREPHDRDLQAALDGTISPAEAARLGARLQADPQAQRDFEALREVDAALRQLESVNPPPELRLHVMRQIRLGKVLAAHPGRARADWLRDRWRSLAGVRPAFQVGLGFALGVLALAPLVWNSAQFSVDPGNVAGTLAVSRKPLARALDIAGPGLSGALLRGEAEGHLTLQLNLVSARPVEARIEFLTPVQGFSTVETDGAGAVALEYSDRHLRFRHSGSGSYLVTLTTATGTWPPMTVKVASEGVSVFEQAVP